LKAAVGHLDARGLRVPRVVVGGLEKPEVARGELERLELALGGVVRLEADALLEDAAVEHLARSVGEGERRIQGDVRLRARRVAHRHRGDRPRLRVRGPEADYDRVSGAEPVAVGGPDANVSGRGRHRQRRVDIAVGARLEAVRDHAALVPVLVGAVAGRRVEDVRDRTRALRQDRRAPYLLDPVEDPVAGLEEVLLDADVRVDEITFVAVRQVRTRRPHEVAAEAVDVVRELDVLERVRDPELVLDLRFGRLGRARVRVAIRRRY
jgi:hypothetical protein